MKIVLLGKGGMLGKAFMRVFADSLDMEVHAFGHSELDILDFPAVSDVINEILPDFVINCVAYTDVDGCEDDFDSAKAINADAVSNLAKACNDANSILIHFSTDYVFDGTNVDGYGEDDFPSPINKYGESKLLGEVAVAKSDAKYYIVRTSWLFSGDAGDFISTMLELSSKTDTVSVVNDQIGAPTFAGDLASEVFRLFLSPTPPPFGIYHITGPQIMSWYDFAKLIFKVANVDIEVKPVSSEQFFRSAKRPNNSVLLNTKLPELKMGSIEEAVRLVL